MPLLRAITKNNYVKMNFWVIFVFVSSVILLRSKAETISSGGSKIHSGISVSSHYYRTVGCLSFDYDNNDQKEANSSCGNNDTIKSVSNSTRENLSNLLWEIVRLKNGESFIIASRKGPPARASWPSNEEEWPYEEVEVGTFLCNEEETNDENTTAVWECLGCLCDTVILNVFLPSKNSQDCYNSSTLRIRDSIQQLLHGMQRRPYNTSNLNSVQLVLNFIVPSSDMSAKQLQIIREIEIFYRKLQEDSVSSLFRLNIETIVTPCNRTETDKDNIMIPAPSWFSSHCFIGRNDTTLAMQQQQQQVPFELFSALATQVYTALQKQCLKACRKEVIPLSGSTSTSDTPSTGSVLDSSQKRSRQRLLTFVRVRVIPTNSHERLYLGSQSTDPNKLLTNTPSTIASTKNTTTARPSKHYDSGILHFQEILRQTNDMLNQLENKQVLACGKPILEFGRDMDDVLNCAMNAVPADGDRSMLINQFIFSERIQQLFGQQMNMLREFYGSQFQRNIEDVVLEEAHSKQQKQELIAKESMRATERFRIAAEYSIPRLCQPGGIVYESQDDSSRNGYTKIYLETMNGLIHDMQQIITDLFDDDYDDEDSSNDEEMHEPQKKKPKKWYNKLANKAIAIGINYIQSALALQALRRAAAERDRNMPKFPLF